MNSLEFTTKIEHGVIHLPKDYEGIDDSVAHVVVTVQSDEEKFVRKQRMFAAWRKLQEVGAFKDIDDPSEWQRKLRDEWE